MVSQRSENASLDVQCSKCGNMVENQTRRPVYEVNFETMFPAMNLDAEGVARFAERLQPTPLKLLNKIYANNRSSGSPINPAPAAFCVRTKRMRLSLIIFLLFVYSGQARRR